MKQFLKHCFTGKDNQTYDIGRILWAFAVIAYVLLCGYYLQKTGQFDIPGCGVGLASLLGGGGVGIGMKNKTEPE